MTDNRQNNGPGKGILSSGQRIITLLVGMVETRLRLAIVELEEEKANLVKLLMMLGLTMVFTAFGLMSLMVLLIWLVDTEYRLPVMIATTAILLLAALVCGLWTLKKSRASSLLQHTRNELSKDKALLEENARE